MVGPRTLPDPADSEPAYWATVYFDPRMVETHWDEDLIGFVILELQNGRGHIGHRSRHRLGCRCISLPVTGVSSRNKLEVRERAIYIARGWLQRILANQVRLDRQRIFFKPGGTHPGPPDVIQDGGYF